MARGKKAAQNANRRVEGAQAELDQLTQRFAEFRKAAERREAELLDELQRTKNRLVHEVDELASAAVERAEMRIEEARAEEREAARRRVIAGFVAMREGQAAEKDTLETLADAADAFGVPLRDIMEKPVGATEPRIARRRMRSSEVRKGFSLVEQAKRMTPSKTRRPAEAQRAINYLNEDAKKVAHG